MEKINVIIYGIMNMRKRTEVEYLLDDKFKIIGYSDSKYSFEYYGNYPFIKLEEINKQDYKYIIIASNSKNSINEIKKTLTDIHVPESKIVWPYFFTFNDRRKNYDIIGNFEESVLCFNGLIFGNSYALRGINTSYLSKCYYNFGWHGLDLYYSYKLLEYLVENERERLKEIKYSILCFPYYYFNYDMSLSLYQLEEGQFWAVERLNDLHHFETLTQYELYLYLYNVNKELFSKNISNHSLAPWEGNDEIFINEEAINKVKITELSHVWSQFHEETIHENMITYNKFINLLLENDIQPLLIVPPYHRIMYSSHESNIIRMKESFYEVIDGVKFSKDIKVFDFFDHDMSNNNLYWADETHLNSIGAEYFTRMIDEYMKVNFYDEVRR